MSVKPIRMSDCASCVSMSDSAILDDDEREDKQWRDRYDDLWLRDPAAARAELKIIDGQTPTEFIVGAVPPSELVRITDECRSPSPGVADRRNELAWRCFLHGIREIRGWEGERPQTKTVAGVEYVDPRWLAETFTRGLIKIALEVGLRVFAYNMITEQELRNLPLRSRTATSSGATHVVNATKDAGE